MMNKVGRLFHAAVEVASVPLAFGLKKGTPMNPKFQQFLVQTGQRLNYRNPPFDNEEKAIELVAEGLTALTMVGTGITYLRKRSQEWKEQEKSDFIKQVFQEEYKKASQDIIRELFGDNAKSTAA